MLLQNGTLFTGYFYIIYYYQLLQLVMAEAIKSIRKISRKLQDSFKLICYFSSRYLSRTTKYGNQYLDEYKKISARIKRQQKKQKVKKNKKDKLSNEKTKKQLMELKARRQKNQRYTDKNYERNRERSYSDDRSEKNNKYNGRYRDQKQQKRKNLQQEPKRRITSLEKQRQFDFDRDFDFNRTYKKSQKPDTTIYFEDEQQQRKSRSRSRSKSPINGKKNLPNQDIGWSKKQFQCIGSKNPKKYTIMKIDQKSSQFQDSDAEQKVPAIKPREPLTPYFLFLRSNRFSISQSYPNIHKFGTFGKVWKDLPEQQKKPFIEQYRRSQQIYFKMLEQYNAVNQHTSKNKRKTDNENEKKRTSITQQNKNKRKRRGKNKDEQDEQFVVKQAKPRGRRKKSEADKGKQQFNADDFD